MDLYRVHGVVTNELPFSFFNLGTEPFVTVSTGRSFSIYKIFDQSLQFVSPSHEKPIETFQSCGKFVVTSVGATLRVFHRTTQVNELYLPNCPKVKHMLAIGDHVLTIDTNNRCRLHSVPDLEPATDDDAGFLFTGDVTSISHPNTFANEVVVGMADGTVERWNMVTGAMLHTVNFIPPGPIAVSCLEQSPFPQVYAIGFTSGHVVLVDIVANGTIGTVRHEGEGAVLSASFRDVGTTPVFATSTSTGALAVWDLSGPRHVYSQPAPADSGAIPSIQFIKGESILLTSHADNALRQWVFDDSTCALVPLKERAGHRGIPSLVQFYGADGAVVGQSLHFLITGGSEGVLRATNTILETQNVEFSQGQGLLKKAVARGVGRDDVKLPAVTAVDTSRLHEHRVPSVITAHLGLNAARLWWFDRKAKSDKTLRTSDRKPVSAVCFTGMGDSALVASVGGSVDMYNVQSGRLVATLPGSVPVVAVRPGVDNRAVVVRTDGTVEVYAYFRKLDPVATVKAGGDGVTATHAATHGNLVAVVTGDRQVVVIDTVLKGVVRRFEISAPASDIHFAPRGSQIIVSDMDGGLTTFDLAESRVVTQIQFNIPVTSFGFINNGYLATTHVGEQGVFEWVIRREFVRDTEVVKSPYFIELPVPTVDVTDDDDEARPRFDGVTADPSILWARLAFYDEIKRTTKTKKAATATSAQLPFYLVAKESLSRDVEFDTTDFVEALAAEELASEQAIAQAHSRRVAARLGRGEWCGAVVPVFLANVYAALDSGDLGPALQISNPAAVMEAIAALSWDDSVEIGGDELSSAEAVGKFILAALELGQSFDFVQGLLRVYLARLGEEGMVEADPDLMSQLADAQADRWDGLRDQVQRCGVGLRWAIDLN
ncbi:Trp-Asp (WD) repeats circular [Carpediemonas membranifera]|uniref:Trp-Asp (WD) repeats circular n=1 Tax=Carpediemonas membranifera TaxID=201153 RepID=A0A8J6E3A7_9EUKA|nr:Trp-Asp (WD) repeats circular [Carpediemonas membranifera]|eukprot:KAG9395693.1 Trp-Asp (WD) repeats circular [Carpediemonas membranifera]